MSAERRTLPATESAPSTVDHWSSLGSLIRKYHLLAAFGVVCFLAFANLADYPLTWFDEGEHLGVARTIVRHGVYAEHTADGFRYYGPTTSVGPTVILPVAASFRLFGVGLVQGRLGMALYLIAAVVAFFALARLLAGHRVGLIATAILLVSPGVALVEQGRQALGEVAGLFFMLSGLLLWFRAWERAGAGRLMLVGLLFGIAAITKHQYALMLLPTLLLGGLTNACYYRRLPHRAFLIPALATLLVILAWQAYMLVFLGPSGPLDNLPLVRESVEAAAFVFAPEFAAVGARRLLAPRVFLSALPIGIGFGILLARRPNPKAQQWGILLTLLAVNLTWFLMASVGWLRYAFPALVIGALLVAAAFDTAMQQQSDSRDARHRLLSRAGRGVAIAWIGAMIAVPGAQLLREIVQPQPNWPLMMAAYLNTQTPLSARIESFEPEIAFLTDHQHHTPPVTWIQQAVSAKWKTGDSLTARAEYLRTRAPDYLIIGKFGRWVEMYPHDVVTELFVPVTEIGEYELWVRRSSDGALGHP